MSTAEWGIVLGLIGTLTGTGTLFWRVIEWYLSGRPRLKVVGSAGRQGQQGPQPIVLYGERFGEPDLITVTAICKGSPLTVTKAGFYDDNCGTRYHIAPLFGHLPARLQRGESVVVAGRADALIGEVDSLERLFPYCEDAEERTYRGKTDGHFKHLVALAGEVK